ncbi:ferrous iron transport protein B [Butyricicoccus porcorum]|uniref:Ferrous iron transport protein B n=1 Tax=Butyricicoccus porcorum TaxID=1945634 RepID=A0A252F464_9FIRM|nr:ferrous iron transport protein B [Butyricicoccus porcorum]OUM20430.1 ferrous iron transport protein B [Butyricicoccus porcorum]
MELRIALAGNPNCGKTTLFNALTGSNQYVGNWPGVTVEKKEGKLKKHADITITDLPGIYSLSPYTLEEVVARNYLIGERPDAILNIVDGTNLERNLYLTTQLTELGIPVVVAVNMMDVVQKNGDKINIAELSRELGCKVVEISALKGTGILEAAEAAIDVAKNGKTVPMHTFSGAVEHAIAHIEEAAVHEMPEEQQRWYAIKIFERDDKVLEQMNIAADVLAHIEADIKAAEDECDDDAESIITNERYIYIASLMKGCYKKARTGQLSTSDKIDRIVTNRILALPIFAVIMWAVYTISIGTIGDWTVGFMNDTLFGEWIVPGVTSGLKAIGCADWLTSLVADGIVGGVGAVLGFVPQMLILFLLLSILEDCGYMSRVAFIMDRIFRKFGLSGKSFIPMLVASGCGVPGVMASRTIEQDRDRKMTIMTTCFIPCGAKMPIVGLISGAVFGGSAWVATAAYFIGVAAVIVSGIILKKTKAFAGDPAPFVMELPAYHAPVASNVLRATWERGWSFIKRAGTVIVAASIIIWVLNSLTFEGGFHYIGDGDEMSILNVIGEGLAVLFVPLGFGEWQAAVATILGLVAKEEVVGVFGSLSSMANADLAMELVEEGNSAALTVIGQEFFGGSGLAAFSFMIFNLLCAPCFAAMGAIKREMNNAKWTCAAIGYMCAFAYAVSLVVYQLGTLFTGGGFSIWTAAAIVVLIGMLYLLFRRNKYNDNVLAVHASAAQN